MTEVQQQCNAVALAHLTHDAERATEITSFWPPFPSHLPLSLLSPSIAPSPAGVAAAAAAEPSSNAAATWYAVCSRCRVKRWRQHVCTFADSGIAHRLRCSSGDGMRSQVAAAAAAAARIPVTRSKAHSRRSLWISSSNSSSSRCPCHGCLLCNHNVSW